FGTESVAFRHQALNRQSWKLFQTVQIHKIGRECSSVAFLQKGFHAEFPADLYPVALALVGIFADVRTDFISFVIVCRRPIYFRIRDFVDPLYEIAHTVPVDGPTELNLCFRLVSLGYSHLPHVVPKTRHLDVSPLGEGDGG